MVSDTGELQSPKQILQNLEDIRNLRREGSKAALNQKVLSLYADSERYGSLLSGGVSQVAIDHIRDGELERMGELCSRTGKAQLEEIMKGSVPPSFQEALSFLSSRAPVTDGTSMETRKLIERLDISGQNRAVEYAQLVNRKRELEGDLASLRLQIQPDIDALEAHNNAKESLTETAEKWDAKKWTWLKPLGKITGLGAVATTVGSSFWNVASGFWSGAVGEGIKTGLSTVPQFLGSQFTGLAKFTAELSGATSLTTMGFAGSLATGLIGGALMLHLSSYPITWMKQLNHRWKRERMESALEKKKKALGIVRKEAELETASALLETRRKQCQETYTSLVDQQRSYEESRRELVKKIENGVNRAANQRLLENALESIESLETLKTLYQIGEPDANYATRFPIGQRITADEIVENIRALHTDHDREDALLELANREEKRLHSQQKQLNRLKSDRSVSSEIRSLNDKQADELQDLLEHGSREQPLYLSFLDQRSKIAMAVRTIYALPLGNKRALEAADHLLSELEKRRNSKKREEKKADREEGGGDKKADKAAVKAEGEEGEKKKSREKRAEEGDGKGGDEKRGEKEGGGGEKTEEEKDEGEGGKKAEEGKDEGGGGKKKAAEEAVDPVVIQAREAVTKAVEAIAKTPGLEGFAEQMADKKAAGGLISAVNKTVQERHRISEESLKAFRKADLAAGLEQIRDEAELKKLATLMDYAQKKGRMSPFSFSETGIDPEKNRAASDKLRYRFVNVEKLKRQLKREKRLIVDAVPWMNTLEELPQHSRSPESLYLDLSVMGILDDTDTFAPQDLDIVVANLSSLRKGIEQGLIQQDATHETFDDFEKGKGLVWYKRQADGSIKAFKDLKDKTVEL